MIDGQRPARTDLPARRLTLLVVYFQRDLWPMRPAFAAHIFAWKRYAAADVLHLNVGFPYDPEALAALGADVVIYDSSALTLRWYGSGLAPLLPAARALATTPALKVALPHDEFLLTDALVDALRLADVRLVLSVLAPEAWPELYGFLLADGVTVTRILTGYLDEGDVRTALAAQRPLARRRWWLRYRAWDAEPWAGAQGRLKVEIGRRAAAICKANGRAADVSFAQSDTVGGADWFLFLADSRATVGCEGGSSVLDRDGSIKAASDAGVAPSREQERATPLAALSPRHLEAAATRTCQILVRADYDGVLRPEVHYIPVRRDLSDLEHALARLEDDDAVQAMVDRAYRDIVASGEWTWQGFVRRWIDDWATGLAPSLPEGRRFARARRRLAEARGRLTMRLEHAYGVAPAPVHGVLKRVLGLARPLLQRPPRPFA